MCISKSRLNEQSEEYRLFYKAMAGDMESYYKLSPIKRIQVDNYLERIIDIFDEYGNPTEYKN